jgi:FtsZ-interacting cell division protein ZipA
MDMTAITAIVGAVAAISGIVLGWSGRSKSIQQEVKQEAGAGASLRLDMDYIKRGVDDIRLEQRAHGKRLDELTERVTRVEESSKQAHKRIDRVDNTPRSERDE